MAVLRKVMSALFRHSKVRAASLILPIILVAVLIAVAATVFITGVHRSASTGASSAHASARSRTLVDNPDVGPGTRLNVSAPGFTLRDQRGHVVSLEQYRGKVVVLAFIDSHCTTVCPLTTQSLLDAMRLLGPASANVQLIGIDSNPKAIRVADVAAYTRAHHMQGRWEFLTGSLPQLKRVWHDYHVYVAAVGNDIDHEPVFYVIGPKGRERTLYLTQMSYEGVAQQAQLLADTVAHLLPSHTAVAQRVSLRFVPPIEPGQTVQLTDLKAHTVIFGPTHPHLVVFFAGWLDEDTDLSAKLAAIGQYARMARRRHLPTPLIVDEVTTEPPGTAAHSTLTRFASAAHIPVINDSAGRLADGYSVEDLPWFVLTSKSGKIIWHHDGWLTGAAVVRAATTALAGGHS